MVIHPLQFAGLEPSPHIEEIKCVARDRFYQSTQGAAGRNSEQSLCIRGVASQIVQIFLGCLSLREKWHGQIQDPEEKWKKVKI